ncbi:MAG TPA: peptide-methionine (S)-S-oxide reductase MsrA [Rhizomicrobium sp.]|jgi:peptide-methionine (S)-S-oxide reductase|nr:peptide-methionine (S)-S-oxide reductase MsrA [Rhizomicrobium sp.]
MKFRSTPILTSIALTLSLVGAACADETPRTVAAPAYDPAETGMQTAVLAGGCFWGQQGLFQRVKGVSKVVAGYSGGARETAVYEMVGTETTGHAESVQITYDPTQISYGKLLQIYFSVAHDPTQLNRQGPDSGPSYRSEIFFNTPEQEKVARAYIDQLNKAHAYGAPIVTKVEKNRGFYKAEGYHQDYLIHHPTQPYIVVNDLPKVDNFKKMFPSLYRDTPVMITAMN